MKLVAYAAFYLLVGYLVLGGIAEAIGRIMGIESTGNGFQYFVCIGFIGVIASLLSWTDDLDEDDEYDDDDGDRDDVPQQPEEPVKIHKVA